MIPFIQSVQVWIQSLRSERWQPRRYRLDMRENLFSFRRELRRDIHRRLEALKLVTRGTRHVKSAVESSS